jgi:hypothetical protein
MRAIFGSNSLTLYFEITGDKNTIIEVPNGEYDSNSIRTQFICEGKYKEKVDKLLSSISARRSLYEIYTINVYCVTNEGYKIFGKCVLDGCGKGLAHDTITLVTTPASVSHGSLTELPNNIRKLYLLSNVVK